MDPIEQAIEKFATHPSISKIKSRCPHEYPFELHDVTFDETLHEIMRLNKSKKTSRNIPVKMLQLVANDAAHVLTGCFNTSLSNDSFPEELKFADIIPIHKKDSTNNKANYRPISLLPTVSKVFEKLVFKQLSSFFESRLNKLLCGFRKKYSTQHSLFNLIKDWQKCVDKSGKVGAILMDLSKAYDCLPHDLLIAKLAAYGIGKKSLRFLYSYLTSRRHRVCIGSSISEWLEVLLGVHQGYILGPILFNIFINDLLFFIEKCDICNFADDNTLYACDETFDKVLSRLKFDLETVTEWFKLNSMIANPEKFQIIFLGNKNNDSFTLNINDCVVRNSASVKLLGILIDDNLSFIPHITNMCNKANQSIKGLLRIKEPFPEES